MGINIDVTMEKGRGGIKVFYQICIFILLHEQAQAWRITFDSKKKLDKSLCICQPGKELLWFCNRAETILRPANEDTSSKSKIEEVETNSFTVNQLI